MIGMADSLEAAVLQSLNWYQYDNAMFLAERFHAEGIVLHLRPPLSLI